MCQAHFVTLNAAEGLRDFHVQQNIREVTQNIFNVPVCLIHLSQGVKLETDGVTSEKVLMKLSLSTEVAVASFQEIL